MIDLWLLFGILAIIAFLFVIGVLSVILFVIYKVIAFSIGLFIGIIGFIFGRGSK